HADMGRRGEYAHQVDGQRRGDEGGAAEAHDGHAGGHAGPVGEPFDQGRDRRDVADAETATADEAVAEVDYPDVVDIDAAGGDEESTAEAACRREHGAAGSAFLDPAAEDRRRDAKHDDADGEDPTQL